MSPERIAVIFIVIVVIVAILVVLWGLFGAPSGRADTFASLLASELNRANAQRLGRAGCESLRRPGW
jgi:hypothetical protein